MKLKKIISAALAFLMLSGCIMIGSASAADTDALPFKDVGAKKWFYEAVKYVYDGGLMNGTTADKFEPNAQLSRAMFITILGRLAGAETKESNVFPDIKKNSWYSGYVGWAVEAGVVKGYDDGTFKPNKSLSRQEMAVAVDRFITYLDCRMTQEGGMWNFSDQKKVASWAKDSLAVLRNSGVIEGDQNGNFNPKNNITRAEAATIIMKLQKAIANAWQGYLPEDGADPIVLGASYLYWTGSACAGGMGHDINNDGEYPVLESFMDNYAADRSYHFANTIGVSLSYMKIDIKETPFVKIAYRYNGVESDVSTIEYVSNMTKEESAGFRETVALTAGADDAGMKTATADLSAIPTAHSNYYASSILTNLLLYPFAEDYTGDAKFEILYFAFFKTQAEADAFNVNSDAEINTYLKDYELYSTLDWKEYTAEDREYYEQLLADRIKEVKNSESEITPEMVKANGGNVYYISSLNGSDDNDGLTPETPWRNVRKLFDVKAGGKVWLHKLQAGDGIFFERGNTFYAEHLTPNDYPTTESGLASTPGCYYGAYGEGDKPLFTTSIDFSDSNNTGNWQATEYANIWVIDCPERTDDVGRIYFNEGEAVGVRVIAMTGNTQTFAEGVKSHDKGFCSSGIECYYSGNTDMTNAGTALKNNLEFFYDNVENKVYLYWDKGNPSDSFYDIKVPRTGTCGWAKEGVTFDNLAFMYTTHYAVRASSTNVSIINCEIGYVGGGLSSVESGVEIFGATDGVYYRNNFIHDIGDGGITSQCTASGNQTEPNIIKNIEITDNVFVACGLSVEIWNHLWIQPDGYSLNTIENVLIKNNLIAYNGYGVFNKQDTSAFEAGSAINSSMYAEFVNSRVEDNVFLYPMGNIYGGYVATYDQPRGWMMKNNTYICNTNFLNIGYCYETLNYLDHHMWKRARVSFPYTYESLAWYTSLGADSGATYYHFDEMTDAESKYCFFTTGYWAERGGLKLK